MTDTISEDIVSEDLEVDSSLVKRYGNQTPTKMVLPGGHDSFLEYNIAQKKQEQWGFKLLPWQKSYCRELLAFTIIDNAKEFAYKTSGLSLGRQQGKSECIIFDMLFKSVILGLNCDYSSYHETSYTKIYKRVLAKIKSSEYLRIYFPTLPTTKTKEKVIYAVDPKTGESLGSMSFYTRRGGQGRGNTTDVIYFDEAQILTKAEYSAIAPATLTRKWGQTIFLGTPSTFESSATFGRGVSMNSGTFFLKLRQGLLEGKNDRAFWMEWGVDKLTPKDDKDAWYRVLPSLGYTFPSGDGITESDLIGRVEDDEEFNTEFLGYWPEQHKSRAIDISRWRDLSISQYSKTEELHSNSSSSIAVKNSFDGSKIYVSLSIRRDDNKILTELMEVYDTSKPWSDLLFNLLKKFLMNSSCVSILVDGELVKPILVQKLQDARLWNSNSSNFRQGKVIMVNSREIGQACSSFITLVTEKKIVHTSQKLLDLAVGDAKKREFRGQNETFAFDSISGLIDVTPLEVTALSSNSLLKYTRSISKDENEEAGWLQDGQGKVYEGFGAFK